MHKKWYMLLWKSSLPVDDMRDVFYILVQFCELWSWSPKFEMLLDMQYGLVQNIFRQEFF